MYTGAQHRGGDPYEHIPRRDGFAEPLQELQCSSGLIQSPFGGYVIEKSMWTCEGELKFFDFVSKVAGCVQCAGIFSTEQENVRPAMKKRRAYTGIVSALKEPHADGP